jgi:hypothetical protein
MSLDVHMACELLLLPGAHCRDVFTGECIDLAKVAVHRRRNSTARHGTGVAAKALTPVDGRTRNARVSKQV